jgi:hypothetical protein
VEIREYDVSRKMFAVDEIYRFNNVLYSRYTGDSNSPYTWSTSDKANRGGFVLKAGDGSLLDRSELPSGVQQDLDIANGYYDDYLKNKGALGSEYDVNPRILQKEKGAVEVLVKASRESGQIRIKRDEFQKLSDDSDDRGYFLPGEEERHNLLLDELIAHGNNPHFRRDLHDGGHYRKTDKEVISFFRAFERDTPLGKALVVMEIQGDWPSDRSKYIAEFMDNLTERQKQTKTKEQLEAAAREYARDQGADGHPLLSSYEALAAKAAIQHATRIGATHVIFPDGRSAMVAEGHDRKANLTPVKGQSGTFDTTKFRPIGPYLAVDEQVATGRWKVDALKKGPSRNINQIFFEVTGDGKTEWLDAASLNDEAERALPVIMRESNVATEIRQTDGMRLHYDRKIPALARKLTNDKGVNIDLGGYEPVDRAEVTGKPTFTSEWRTFGRAIQRATKSLVTS